MGLKPPYFLGVASVVPRKDSSTSVGLVLGRVDRAECGRSMKGGGEDKSSRLSVPSPLFALFWLLVGFYCHS